METVAMLDPATPNAERAKRSAATSRAVNRESTWGHYGISSMRPLGGKSCRPRFLAADLAYD
jgi:hypothetical protein